MSRTIPAIFDAGVFRPLEPVELAEGTQVEVQVFSTVPEALNEELSPEALKRQQAAIAEFLAEMESLPDELSEDSEDEDINRAWKAYLDRMESLPSNSSQDGLTSRDRDRIIFGM